MSRWRASVAALLALGLGCRGKPAPMDDEPPAPAAAAPTASEHEQTPVDHLAPGELIEGTKIAMGIKLPRDLALEEAFDNVAYARGLVPVHSLVLYFRQRVRDGSLREGELSATFEHVHAPSRPDRELSIHMGTTVGGVRVEIRDTTPPVASNLPNDEARLRQVGLRPDGRWVDPTHLK